MWFMPTSKIQKSEAVGENKIICIIYRTSLWRQTEFLPLWTKKKKRLSNNSHQSCSVFFHNQEMSDDKNTSPETGLFDRNWSKT